VCSYALLSIIYSYSYLHYPAKTINTVKAWMAQQQKSKTYQGLKNGAFRAEFEISASRPDAA
jgi:hypothetical protein